MEGFNESDIIYADDEVPFGPLGVFPENYTELQAKVLSIYEREESEDEESSSAFSECKKHTVRGVAAGRSWNRERIFFITSSPPVSALV